MPTHSELTSQTEAPAWCRRALLVVLIMTSVVGCRSLKEAEIPLAAEGVQLDYFTLSPGDEVKISVYKHQELGRTITLPSDGVVFFPVVGEVDTTGLGVKDLRLKIAQGLSAPRKQVILPGDAVSIRVFLHEEYDRQLIVPSDSRLFFPQVGEINVESMSLSELRETIAQGLSGYVVDPQVMIDITELNNPSRIVDPQVTIELVGLRGQRMFVLGEVGVPGAYAVQGYTRLVEVLSLAGGFTDDADPKSVLLARSGGPDRARALTLISVQDFLSTGDERHNPLVKSGDIVYVHRSRIANVDRFFLHLSRIISPFLDLQTGMWIGQNIIAGPSGSRAAP